MHKCFCCKLCGIFFTQRGNLKTHQRLHRGEKRFACPTCKRAFAKKQNLKTHLFIHSGLKPFKCNVCGRAFNRNSNRKRHEKRHILSIELGHYDQKPFYLSSDSNSDSSDTTSTTHVCRFCQKTFKKSGFYERHIQKHLQMIYPVDDATTSPVQHVGQISLEQNVQPHDSIRARKSFRTIQQDEYIPFTGQKISDFVQLQLELKKELHLELLQELQQPGLRIDLNQEWKPKLETGLWTGLRTSLEPELMPKVQPKLAEEFEHEFVQEFKQWGWNCGPRAAGLLDSA